jgi:hypothetical protein
MCLFSPPDIPDPKPPAQFQQMQPVADMTSAGSKNPLLRKQRGLYASLFTSPQGVGSRPTVTGTMGGVTGG